MTRSFAALVSYVCLLLGTCGLFVTVTNCSGMIRSSVVSIFMSALAWGYLKQANEEPIGFWVTLYRSGVVIAGSIVLFAISRIVSSMQGVGCQI